MQGEAVGTVTGRGGSKNRGGSEGREGSEGTTRMHTTRTCARALREFRTK